jgi:type I restriction enzyme S subunit
MICVSPLELSLIQSILKKHAPDCEARAFGSRYKWTANDYSDLDIALAGGKKLTLKKLCAVKDAFEESTLPFRVDVLDWNAVSAEFREIISNGYEVIYAPEKQKTAWPIVRLGDVATVIGGGTPSTSHAEYWNGDVSWITPKDLTGYTNIYINKGERSISRKGLENSSARILPEGTVLLTTRAPIGYVAIASAELCTNQGFKSFICDNKKLHNLFLYYWLKGNTEYLQSIGTGTTFMEIPGKRTKEIEIPIPPLPTQQAIAATLSCLDDKIELNNRINANLEAQAQAIFKSWFVDFEPWGGVMPNDWREGTIRDIADDIVCDKTPSTKIDEYFGEDIPFITIPDMHGRIYVTSTERSLSKPGEESQANKTVPPNSICVSCIATAGLVVLTSTPSQTNQQINTIICKNNISSFFVYLTMLGISDHIKMLGSSGSATNNLNKSQFEKIKILIPEVGRITKFATIVAPLFERIKCNQQESENLALLRDTLLPRLMSGEIKIKEENL